MLVLLAASFFTAQLAPVDFTSSGGQLFANGAPFQIKGAIWRGAEGPGDLPEGLTGVHAHTIGHYMEALAEGTFNAVKITFNHQAVLDAAVVEHFDPQVEQSLIGKRYLQARCRPSSRRRPRTACSSRCRPRGSRRTTAPATACGTRPTCRRPPSCAAGRGSPTSCAISPTSLRSTSSRRRTAPRGASAAPTSTGTPRRSASATTSSRGAHGCS